MNRMVMILGGLGVGAGLAYVMNPTKGRDRRAMLRTKATGAVKGASGALGAGRRALTSRRGRATEDGSTDAMSIQEQPAH
jgi:hypothetical protein